MLTVDFDRIRLEPGGRVLDVGCGSGRHTAAAARFDGVLAVGVDVALSDLGAARDRLQLHARLEPHLGGRWALCAADGLQLPFPEATFDLVICAEVLEHLRAVEQAVAESLRVLKPGGGLVVSVPRSWPERVCWRLSREYACSAGGHVRILSRKALAEILGRAGAGIRAAHHAHSLHTPFWWLKCIVGLRRENAGPVNLYHRFLTWDLMRRPRVTRFLERLLNPVLGKSLVVYCRKSPVADPSRRLAAPDTPSRA
jgi:ubiquinone/menaquinone biosynthesis C-methylase UbiE